MKQAITKAAARIGHSGSVNRRVREGLLIIFISLALYMLVALMTHHNDDPGWSQTGASNGIVNLAGKTGAWFSDVLFFLFGYIAYCLPVMILFMGVFIYQPTIIESSSKNTQMKLSVWYIRIAGFVLALLTSCGLASMHAVDSLDATAVLSMTSGGLLGIVVKTALVSQLNHIGATIILLAFFLASITLFTGLSWLKLTDLLGHYTWHLIVKIRQESPGWFQTIKKGCIELKNSDYCRQAQCKLMNSYQYCYEKIKKKTESLGLRKNLQKETNIEIQDDVFDDVYSFRAAMEKMASEPSIGTPEYNFANAPVQSNIKPALSTSLSSNMPFNPAVKQTNQPMMRTQSSAHVISNSVSGSISTHPPSLALLDASEARVALGFNKTEVANLSQLVERRLTEFGVQAKVVGVQPGPVVTRFELDLAAGIKVSKISGLAKDLARSLSVMSVRVVEVIPGKSYIGIEIPNEKREMVRLKEILTSTGYQSANSPLTLGLGKDIAGRPVSVDLAKMPHLLVAGTTGSGKSVGINAMILSILYKASPEEVRMILIDPKMLELSVYDKIPHLLTPVVTDMKDAASALRWCVAEMESRYQLMAALGVRNLAGYNQKIEDAQRAQESLFDPFWEPNLGMEPGVLTKKPYIVVVVDEFADLIMVVGKQVEELIARIAQKARAAGIHLILATQRPSVDVITGLIKANIPTRIAFQVSCRIDSRTVLDQSGAEQLLGHGDMLYLAPGAGIPQRIHGAFVSDEEVHKVANQWRKQGVPDYIESILKSSNSIAGFDSPRGGDEYDELYDEAVKIVTESRRPSISHVQRRLRIGYNRAACLIEQMERDGVLSAMQSNGTREVLAPPPVER